MNGKNNELILDYLSKLAKQKQAEGDKFRARAYRNAIKSIRDVSFEISSGSEAQQKLTGVGASIAKKIDEILTTGHLRVVDGNDQEKQRILERFEQVWGAGPVTAQKWYQKGYRTIADIKHCEESTLTKQQKVGLEFYDDLQDRMSRDEASKIMRKIQNTTRSLQNHGLRMMACGSYRREEETCGDLDILLTHDNKPVSESHLATFVYMLHRVGILVADLAYGEQTYMGICKLNGKSKGRRIDIKIIPKESWAAATLYFTGSQTLNIMMRQNALEKGWILNEKGLFAGREGSSQKLIRLKCDTEQDIFDKLDMPYLHPKER